MCSDPSEIPIFTPKEVKLERLCVTWLAEPILQVAGEAARTSELEEARRILS